METAQEHDGTPSSGAQWLERWRRSLIIAALVFAIIIIGRFTPISPVRGVFESFGWVTEQAVDLAKELFERWGYQTVLLAPMLENTIFIGALIPGTLVMLLAGLSAHDGLISFWPAVLLAIAGAIIGDTISYGMGRFGWQRLGPETRLARWSEQMREPLLNHSIWLVLSYHFAGYSRLIGPAAAGFLRMPLPRWMLLDYVGVSLWVLVFLSAGYLLGVLGLSLETSDRNVQVFEIFLFAFFVLAVITIVRAANRNRARLRAAGAAPTSSDGRLRDEAVVLEATDELSEGARERTG